MSNELISIIVLVAIFAVATLLPINMGVLGLVAAFGVGTAMGVAEDDVSISSSVVDSSPFSTSGALVVANTPAERRDFVFKRLMQWGMSMVVIAPPVAWLIFVVPGWL